MRPWVRSLSLLLALGVPASPHAQDGVPSDAATSGSPPTGSETLSRLPAGAYQVDPAVGVPMRSLFRNTKAPYTDSLRPLSVSPTLQSDSITARAHLGLPSLNADLPFLDRGFEPNDADLKLGPLFFDLRALTGAVLFSDNINRTEDNRESGAIAMIRLSGSILAQLTEGTRLAVSGSFTYLPLEGSAGLSGFGIGSGYGLGLAENPNLRSQLTWDTIIGGWNVLFADEFQVGVSHYSIGTRDNFALFEGADYEGVDRAGNYSFRAPRNRVSNGHSERHNTDSDFLSYSNTVSASTERLLPGSIRLRARAYHENLWYNQGNRGLPSLREGISVLLRDEKEDVRFKPFLSYRATRTDRTEGINQELRVGVNGPLTEQIQLHLDAGLFHHGRNGSTSYLWGLELRHLAGPYTEESLSAGRSVSDFSDEIHDHVTYQLRQVLGPSLNGTVFASLARVEDLEGEFSERRVFRTGTSLSYRVGPKTALTLRGIYSHVHSARGDYGDYETWTGRLELDHQFTDALRSRLIYQHQTRDSDQEDASYEENFLYFSLTRYFR